MLAVPASLVWHVALGLCVGGAAQHVVNHYGHALVSDLKDKAGEWAVIVPNAPLVSRLALFRQKHHGTLLATGVPDHITSMDFVASEVWPRCFVWRSHF